MTHPYVVVDAFSDQPLLGNPVAVIFGSEDLESRTMQMIAAELQLSEATFVDGRTTPHGTRVRIFTPVNELPFAGHPLIGTARACLDRTGQDAMTFVTARGPVRARRLGGARVSITQPVPEVVAFDRPETALDALGIDDTVDPPALYDAGARHLLVHVPTTETLRALTPDQVRLARLEDMAVNCFTISAGTILNRMFSPAYGVVEDAATGSACAPLAMHAVRHGHLAPGGTFTIRQGEQLGKACEMSVNLDRIHTDGVAVLSGATALVATGRLEV